MAETEFEVLVDKETDGRFIARIDEIPGVMAYGPTEEAAKEKVKEIARCVHKSKAE